MFHSLQLLDYRVLLFFNHLIINFWGKEIIYAFARFGIIVFFAVGIYLWFWKTPRDHKGFLHIGYHKNREAVVMAIFALIIGFVIDEIIGLVLPRPRPFIAHPDLIKHLNLSIDLTSFPSSHAIAVFAVSTSLAFSHIQGFRNWGIFLFIMAFLIAVSRVAAGVHYPSDILAGMLIGFFSGWIIHENEDKIKRYIFREQIAVNSSK